LPPRRLSESAQARKRRNGANANTGIVVRGLLIVVETEMEIENGAMIEKGTETSPASDVTDPVSRIPKTMATGINDHDIRATTGRTRVIDIGTDIGRETVPGIAVVRVGKRPSTRRNLIPKKTFLFQMRK